MENKRFEKRIVERMEGFTLKPSATVWEGLEKRIGKEKKRKALAWWWIMGISMAGICIQSLYRHENKVQTISMTNTMDAQGTNTLDARDEKQNAQIHIEDPMETGSKIVSSLNNESKNQHKFKDQVDAIQVIYNKRNNGDRKILFVKQKSKNSASAFENEESNNNASEKSPKNLGLETIKEWINKEAIEQHAIAVEKKGNDTIVILRCEDMVKPQPLLKQSANPEKLLNFNAHLAFHGTGDLSGTNLEFGTERRWGKRYGFYNNLGLTIHSGQEVSLSVNAYPLQMNSTYNALQTVTFGIQTIPTIYRYSKRGDLKIGAGLVARYQMSSYGNYTASSLGNGNGANQYAYTIYKNDPNTFSIGYRISADLLLYETKKNKLGFQIFFQNDTRGDVITGLGLSFQTKYKK